MSWSTLTKLLKTETYLDEMQCSASLSHGLQSPPSLCLPHSPESLLVLNRHIMEKKDIFHNTIVSKHRIGHRNQNDF